VRASTDPKAVPGTEQSTLMLKSQDSSPVNPSIAPGNRGSFYHKKRHTMLRAIAPRCMLRLPTARTSPPPALPVEAPGQADSQIPWSSHPLPSRLNGAHQARAAPSCRFPCVETTANAPFLRSNPVMFAWWSTQFVCRLPPTSTASIDTRYSPCDHPSCLLRCGALRSVVLPAPTQRLSNTVPAQGT